MLITILMIFVEDRVVHSCYSHFFPVNKQKKEHRILTCDERLEGRDREEESRK